MIELEQRYNTKCNIDTSPLLVEETAQQEWNPFGDINVNDIPMQKLDTWKEEDDKVNEPINDSCSDEPAPQFNNVTYKQVDVDLLILGPEQPPQLEFWPLNYQQRKTIASRIFHLM